MKTYILLISLLVLTQIHAQKEKSAIILRSGETKVGYVKDTKSDLVKFYENEKSEPLRIKYSEIEKIDYTDINETTYSIQINDKGTHKLLELLTSGKVSLYKSETRNFGTSSMNTGGMNMEGGTVIKFYLKRSEENYATLIGYGGIIKNKAIKYFSDCDSFIIKIKDRKFRRQNPKIIIDYYNDNCTN